jgi:formamidopyrimidine-DNA glycosylase
VGRRAKNVLLRLDDGGVLLVNLGMTGWLAARGIAPRDPPRPTHPALTFRLQGGGALVFDDVRRFGCVERLDAAGWSAREATFGPEPLEDGFVAAELERALSTSRSPIRSWLLDQRRLAGVGNIYANEALHRARVHPARPARSLERAQVRALHRAIRDVLREALRAGGTTIQDYRNAEGEPGEFVRELRVYGREGQACRRCKAPVERLVFANRSAFLCPTCQPEGPSAPRGG